MSRDGTGNDLHMGQKLAAGSASGCIGATLTTPLELAKTRLQVGWAGLGLRNGGCLHHQHVVSGHAGVFATAGYAPCAALFHTATKLNAQSQAPGATTRSMSAVLAGVVKAQGLRGLWRGATPSVLRLILLNGSMVATYDEVGGWGWWVHAVNTWQLILPQALR
jgi:hypothetical protein